ncbi:tail tape measure protein [Sandarakinorhabdus sp.]|uniref:tail tape measure protein n=1 Tax=Sandarakinorhabdus sp. TaxID=1916663 RepID=UPI003F6F779F
MDEVDELVVKLRADTGGFLAGVGEVQRTLDGPLAAGLERAGAGLSRSLGRALADGKLGFDDLRRIAVSALGDIASQALRLDLRSLFGGGGGVIGGLLGLPGRATGGSVSAGRAYMVGERGPEVFVPTAAGRVEANGAGARPVNITVNVAAPREASAAVMQQTGNQVARAVARALERAR